MEKALCSSKVDQEFVDYLPEFDTFIQSLQFQAFNQNYDKILLEKIIPSVLYTITGANKLEAFVDHDLIVHTLITILNFGLYYRNSAAIYDIAIIIFDRNCNLYQNETGKILFNNIIIATFENVMPTLSSFFAMDASSYDKLLVFFLIYEIGRETGVIQNEDYENPFCLSVIHRLFYVLNSIDDEYLRKIPLQKLLGLFNPLYRIIGKGTILTNDLIDSFLFNFWTRCLGCSVLEKKLFAAHSLVDFVKNGKKQIRKLCLDKCMQNSIIKDILENDPHDELLKTLIPIFKIMAKRQDFTRRNIDSLWSLAHDTNSENALIIISLALNSLYFNEATSFLKNVEEDPSNKKAAFNLFKIIAIEHSHSDDNFAQLAIDTITNNFDIEHARDAFTSLIINNNNFLNIMLSKVINNWFFEQSTTVFKMESVIKFVETGNNVLSIDVGNFGNFILNIYSTQNILRDQTLNLLFVFLYKCNITVESQVYKELYHSSIGPDGKVDDKFWVFLGKVVSKIGKRAISPESELGIMFFINQQDVKSISEQFINFYKEFVLFDTYKKGYLVSEEISDLETYPKDFVLNDLFFESHNLMYTFYVETTNDELSKSINHFLISLLRKAKLVSRKQINLTLVNFIVQTVKSDERATVRYRLLQHYLNWIEISEDNIDLSILNIFKHKPMKNLHEIGINFNDNTIQMSINSSATYEQLKFILAIIIQVSTKSLSFENINNEDEIIDINSLNLVQINQEDETDINEYSLAIAQLYSNIPDLLDLSFDSKVSPVIWKLLKKMPTFEFTNIEELVMNEISPYFFRYLNQLIILKPDICTASLMEYLYQCILDKKYDPKFFKDTYKILATHDINLGYVTTEFINILSKSFIETGIPSILNLLTRINALDPHLVEESFALTSPNALIKFFTQFKDKSVESFILLLDGMNKEEMLTELAEHIIQDEESIKYLLPYLNRIFKIIGSRINDENGNTLVKNIMELRPRYPKQAFLMLAPLFSSHPELVDTYSDNLFEFIPSAMKSDDSSLQVAIYELMKAIPSAISDPILLSAFSESDSTMWEYNPKVFKKSIPGFTGLQNQGATCYMNSVLQQLASINKCIETLFVEQTDNQEIEQMKYLFAYMKFGEGEYAQTNDFCIAYAASHPDFNALTQEDAYEFFIGLVDLMPDSTKELFTGKLTTIISSMQDRVLSTPSEPFTAIACEVKGFTNLHDSLNEFSKIQLMTGSNQYFDSNQNKKIDAKYYMSIASLPPHLVFHLKRFEYDLVQFTRFKIDTRFEFPFELNTASLSDQPANYVLTGVVVHMGYAEGGHYISLVKHGENWLKLDDTRVTMITASDVIDISYGGKAACSNAYLLFYTRIGEEECELSSLLQFLPEHLQNQIKSTKESQMLALSTFSKATYDFMFENKSPEISVLYFLNVLCHSDQFDHAMIYSTHIISIFTPEDILVSISDKVEILATVIKNNTRDEILNAVQIVINYAIHCVSDTNFVAEFLNCFPMMIQNVQSIPFIFGVLLEFCTVVGNYEVLAPDIRTLLVTYYNQANESLLSKCNFTPALEILINSINEQNAAQHSELDVYGPKIMQSKLHSPTYVKFLFKLKKFNAIETAEIGQIVFSVPLVEKEAAGFEYTKQALLNHSNPTRIIEQIASKEFHRIKPYDFIEYLILNQDNNFSEFILQIFDRFVFTFIFHRKESVREITELLILSFFVPGMTRGTTFDNAPNPSNLQLAQDMCQLFYRKISDIANNIQNFYPKITQDGDSSQFILISFLKALKWLTKVTNSNNIQNLELLKLLYRAICSQSITFDVNCLQIVRNFEDFGPKVLNDVFPELFLRFYLIKENINGNDVLLSQSLAIFLPILITLTQTGSNRISEIVMDETFYELAYHVIHMADVENDPTLAQFSEFIKSLAEIEELREFFLPILVAE